MTQCPAKHANCYNCSRIGHFTKFCRSKKQVNLVDTTSTRQKITLKATCHSVFFPKPAITAKVKPLTAPHGTNVQ